MTPEQVTAHMAWRRRHLFDIIKFVLQAEDYYLSHTEHDPEGARAKFLKQERRDMLAVYNATSGDHVNIKDMHDFSLEHSASYRELYKQMQIKHADNPRAAFKD